jgi:hypothetical protein
MARKAQLANMHQPELVLEGSGSFVPDTAGPADDLPATDEPHSVLYADFLPQRGSTHPSASRGSLLWTAAAGSNGPSQAPTLSICWC